MQYIYLALIYAQHKTTMHINTSIHQTQYIGYTKVFFLGFCNFFGFLYVLAFSGHCAKHKTCSGEGLYLTDQQPHAYWTARGHIHIILT